MEVRTAEQWRCVGWTMEVRPNSGGEAYHLRTGMRSNKVMSTAGQSGLKVTISGCVRPGLIFEFTIDRRVGVLNNQLSSFYSLRAGLLVPLDPLETQIGC